MSRTPIFLFFFFILIISITACTKTDTGSLDSNTLKEPILTMTAVKQGVIANNAAPIPIDEFMQQISSPTDASSGLSTGKIKHSPLSITKEVDKNTPKILSAITTNERLTKVIIFFPIKTGKKGIYTITLDNANIVDIKEYKENKSAPLYEDVQFTYEKITGTFTADNAADSNNTNISLGSSSALCAISVTPQTITVPKGENIPYVIVITASPGFNDSVNISLDLDAPILGSHYKLGSFGPEYPYTLNYTMLVPGNIPFGLDITGVMSAKCGSTVATAPLEVHIEGPVHVVGNSLNWVMGTPGKLGKLFESSPTPPTSPPKDETSFTADW